MLYRRLLVPFRPPQGVFEAHLHPSGKPCVSGPTHRAGGTLDLIISRTNENLLDIDSVTQDMYLVDHMSVVCNLNGKKPPPVRKLISYRKTNSIDLDNFKKDILESALLQSPCDNVVDLSHQYDSVLGDTTRKV